MNCVEDMFGNERERHSSYVEGHLHEYHLPTCGRSGVVNNDCPAVRGSTESPEPPVYELFDALVHCH